MRKPRGRNGSRPSSILLETFLLAGAVACSADRADPGAPGGAARTDATAPAVETGSTRSALGDSEAPASVAFQLELDGQSFALSLERTRPPTTTNYQGFRRTREGTLVPLPPPDLGCTYRGQTEPVAAVAGAKPGFAAMSVCSSATGREAGAAASGVLRAGGRFWRLWPDPADADGSDGVDHFAQPLVRNDVPLDAREPVRTTTLVRLPESPAPRLEFREGTDEETKYIDLIVVNDAARVAQLGGSTQATTLQFVDTMNALLDTSGLSPRLRVTLRGQVLFEEDPYSPVFDGDEVDNDSLLNEFLDWGAQEDLPAHDERLLLSGLDFVGGVVGYAGLGVACLNNANGFIVQAGDASGGFAVLSAVHELGHTLGMNHDGTRQDCPQSGFIMAAVGCGNCPGSEQAEFSPCSVEQFQQFLDGPGYAGLRCADDVPADGVQRCGDGAVQTGEACDCGSEDCSAIDPCCNGATCQLADGAECSDFNDGCCQSCTIVSAEAEVVCRPQRSACDIAEACTGVTAACPADTFEPAGDACQDERGNAGACYFGDCRSRATQCEQLAEQEDSAAFDDIGGPQPNCGTPCNQVMCGNGQACITIGGPTVNDGVPCEGGGQCVDQVCVTTIDQCPEDPDKSEPGECGCGQPDGDDDGDGAADCAEACPDDATKQDPGQCGCGTPDDDRDGDNTPDCNDDCAEDPAKSAPGECGCGQLETDTDADGAPDCVDECPASAFERVAGACGCGVAEVDTDADGTPDCVDSCTTDPARTTPPCTLPTGGTDTDGDGDDDSASFRASAKGGCALIAPGAASEAPGNARGLASTLGLLALAGLPLWRRRRARA